MKVIKPVLCRFSSHVNPVEPVYCVIGVPDCKHKGPCKWAVRQAKRRQEGCP